MLLSNQEMDVRPSSASVVLLITTSHAWLNMLNESTRLSVDRLSNSSHLLAIIDGGLIVEDCMHA
jgi:hypothetical protein